MPYDNSGQEYELNTRFPIYYISLNEISVRYCIEDLDKHEKIIQYLNIFLEHLRKKFPNSKNIECESQCRKQRAVPYIRFVNFNYHGIGGAYNIYENIININIFSDIFNLERITRTLFHEYGHFLYRNEIINRNEWLRYYIDNLREIDKDRLKFLRNLYAVKYENQQNMNYDTVLKIGFLSSEYNSKRKEIFVKPESDYQLNEEEIFCETFATYMTGKCLHKSNEEFIRKLLNESTSQSKGSILQYW